MKTILYSLIPIFIFGLVATGFTNHANTKNSILIQSSDKNISSVQLSQSAGIISARLKDFCSGKYYVSVIPGKNQINVMLADSTDFKTAESLILHKGMIEFYETFNHAALVELLKGDGHLFSLLTKSETDKSDTKIGCTTTADAGKVNDYLNTLGLKQKCKFVWTQGFDNPGVCLFALRLYGDKGAIITGNDIESAKYGQDKIQVKLKTAADKSWSDATKRNIGNDIAIVLDNEVLSYPRVMSTMDSGEIEISGKFTPAQAKYIAALLNNGELPAEFVVVK
ncbi:MAG: hypothetical protein ABSA76_06940 [Bacteroidales bacterium]